MNRWVSLRWINANGKHATVTWVLHKIDMVIGACIASAAAMVASQMQAVIDQYLQRLGGHLDEAKLNLDRIENGVRYQTMSETVQRELETDATIRVNELQSAYDAISQSGLIVQPFSFFRHADDTILNAMLVDFVPAIPLSTSALSYSVAGIFIGLIAYKIAKLPLVFVTNQSRRRRFRKLSFLIRNLPFQHSRSI